MSIRDNSQSLHGKDVQHLEGEHASSLPVSFLHLLGERKTQAGEDGRVRLSSSDTQAKLGLDSSRANFDLQRMGVLPRLEIVPDSHRKEGFFLKAQEKVDPAARASEQTGAELAGKLPAGKSGLPETQQRIEDILKKNPHDFSQVFSELERLRGAHPKDFRQELESINKELHKKGFLPHLRIIEDDYAGKGSRTGAEHGYAIVADDKQNPPGNRTVYSTSHHSPHESERLRQSYHHMRYRHGHYNGWEQSAEGSGGSDGGLSRQAIGGHVPVGARKELIDMALKLAGVPITPATEAAVNKIVTRESGWNPNITNTWDSNARAGHPSTGLMQTIPGTFKRFALHGYDSNIHDPLSNLIAGIRYAEHTYGSRGGPGSGILRVASRPGGY